MGGWSKTLCFVLSLGCFSVHATRLVQADDYQQLWDNVIKNPSTLEQFLVEMPKGGDLHCHASGAIPTEHLLSIARKHHYCIDKDLSLSQALDNHQCSAGELISDFVHQPQQRQKIIQAWSMEQFKPNRHEDGKLHFFNTFAKFNALVDDHWPEIIADVRHTALEQHIQYLELMLSMHGPKPQLAQRISYQEMPKLMERADIKEHVQNNIDYFTGLKSMVEKYARTGDKEVALSWILEIKRNQPFHQFALDAYEVFSIANQVPDIVAINMVQPEFGDFANRDYASQMRWLSQLHHDFPKVNIVLHAGEVPHAMAKEQTTGHIGMALREVKPLRIGHGTMILSEPEALASLARMKQEKIAVEINLTSNDEILGITGANHPLNTYLNAKIPVVLSSDDPGISRNTLSHEYYRAVTEHHLSLAQLLQVNRNSISYSMLEGASLWKNPENLTLVADCQELDSVRCLAFIAKNPKALQQWLLEKKMLGFFTTRV
jgi:adenosine deaminase